MQEKINFKEPLNLALFYVLFNGLAELVGYEIDKSEVWKTDHFKNKINDYIKNTLGVDKSVLKEMEVDENLMKRVFPRLRDKPLGKTPTEKFEFEKSTLNKFCKVLKYTENKDYKWDDFKREYKDVAKKALEGNPRRFNRGGLVGKVKVCLGINYIGYAEKERLKTEIAQTIELRMYDVFNGKDIEIIFRDEGAHIKHLEEAREIGVKMGVDLVIYARAFYKDANDLPFQFHYVIINPSYLSRFSSHNLLIKAEGTSGDLLSTALHQLYSGHLQGDIDQALRLLLALKFYLENQSETAASYLAQIPDEKRCEEIWFILGVCHFDLKQYDEAISSWKKAIEKNEKHLKSRKNLAILLLEQFRKIENDNESEVDKAAKLKDEILALINTKLFSDGPSEFYLPLAIIFDELEDPIKAEEFFDFFIQGPSHPGKDYAYIRLSDLLNGKLSHVESAAKISRNYDIQEKCVQKIAEDPNLDSEEKLKMLKSVLKIISNRKEKDTEKRNILNLYNTRIDEMESNRAIAPSKGGSKSVDNIDSSSIGQPLGREKLLEQPKPQYPDSQQTENKNDSLLASHKGRYLKISRKNQSKSALFLLLENLIIRDHDLRDSPFLRIYHKEKERYIEIPIISNRYFVIERDQLVSLVDPVDDIFFINIQKSIRHGNKIHYFEWKKREIYMPVLSEFKQVIHEFVAGLGNVDNLEKMEAIYSHTRNIYGEIDFHLLKDWLKKELIINIT